MNTISFKEFIMPFDTERCFRVTRSDLSNVKRDAYRHNQVLLLYSQMMRQRERIEPHCLIDNFLDELKEAYYLNVFRSVQRELIEHRTVDLLSTEGIPSIILRGNTIAREIYQDPYCRVSADTDLLIRQKDLKHADAILSRNGYVRHNRLPLAFLVNRLHHAVYYYPGTTELLELHWNFCVPSFFRLTSEDIWAETDHFGKNDYKLSTEMMVIHLLVHHHMHAFRELRILTDIIWALFRYDAVLDWNRLGMMVKHIGLVKTAAVTISQIGVVCGGLAATEPVLMRFKDVIENIGGSKPLLLTSHFSVSPEKEYRFQDKKDRFMARIALDSPKNILQSFVTSVFPLPGDLKELYRDRRPWLLPLLYLRFLLWRVKEWTGGV